MNKKEKIIKAILSLTISFLIIFIAAMFARAASNTILPSDNKVSVLINDYLDMMMQMIDKAAVNINVKRNTVSEYQVNLISQSISDYVGYSMYQTADIIKNYNPNKNYSKEELEEYKNDYYKMTVENPYLRGMTIFGLDGKMRLNLYLAKNKSWPLELQDNLIKDIIKKGSLVLNATNENAFYIMEYIKNNFGEMIASTRNDYSYVSDIAMYYQVADKRLYVSDSRNLIYNVRESIGDNTIEKVSSVINRFAYYKKQPSFIVNDSLSVSMIGKEYPNYFELIVLALTALLILLFQLILNGIIHFFKYLMQIKSDKDYIKSLHNEGELFENIDENIINVKLPKSNAIEEMPPIVEKVYYKIPEEYKDFNKKEKFNIKKEILNIVSNIKSEVNKNKKDSNSSDDFANSTNSINSITEKETDNINNVNVVEEEIKSDKEENNIEILIQNEEADDSINFNDINLINNINLIQESELNEVIEDIDDIKIYEKEIGEETEENIEEIIMEDMENIEYIENTDNTENVENITVENNITEESNEDINNVSYQEENSGELIKELVNEKEEYDINNDINIIENNMENETNNMQSEENMSDNVDKDILDSYNEVLTNPKSIETEEEFNFNNEEINEEKSHKDLSKDFKKDNLDDVFAAFDKMLASIISKAEEDARSIIKK